MNKTYTYNFLFLILSIFIFATELFSQNQYLTATPKKGDFINSFLQKYNLPINKSTIKKFKELNADKSLNKDILKIKKYYLPILVYKYKNKTKSSLAKSLGNYDYNTFEVIESYNNLMVKNKLKDKNYKEDKEIWAPIVKIILPETDNLNDEDKEQDIKATSKQDSKKSKRDAIEESNDLNEMPSKSTSKKIALFGDKYESVRIITTKLKDNVYYLVSGHGGPDPGAVGNKDSHELHEDEYAYDVTLRLARKLIENSAQVYVIVQDKSDGIRDDEFLNNSSDETLINGDEISEVQKTRLHQRTAIINSYYEKNKKKYKNQYVIEMHVDSRITNQRIDIFFYHKKNHANAEKITNTLLETIKDKYDKAQPGRGYKGSVSDRSLYTLRNSIPTGIYIELGNIQNPNDQIRLIAPNNRQAIANWLCDGLIKTRKIK